MSWKAYQGNLKKGSKAKQAQRAIVLAFGVGITLFSLLLFVLFGVKWFDNPTPEIKAQIKAIEAQADRSEKLNLKGLIELSTVDDGPSEMRVQRDNEELTLSLTFDHELQRYIQNKLNRYRVDWGAVAVIDPSTGAVLALASHSEKEPGGTNLALRSTFPAASIFKMVTTAAALEEGGYNRESKVSFNGSMYGIGTRQVMRDSGVEGLTLTKAFAKSANIVFGKLATRSVKGNLLETYASRFGFNKAIPFELPFIGSSAEIPTDDIMQEARTAAGFGKVTLSPLHGAMMAGAILNDGKMMEPYIIQKIVDKDDHVKYDTKPFVWKTPVSAVTAREMRKMMMTTLTEGTAHRAFRRVDRNPILSQLQMGGKTGSLSGRNPRGRTEWFVGYGKGQDKQIAVGIVVVNDKVWRVKPSELVKEIFEHYFSARPVLQASVKPTSTNMVTQ